MNERKKGRAEISYEGILENEEEKKSAEHIREDKKADEPLEFVLEAETAKEIQAALSHLDIKYRTVILLYYYNELSTKEIAQITGAMEGTVKSRLHKARKLLKDLLKADGTGKTEMERGFCHG
uniref:RNA polymerase sigma factor n=1 Tax=Clostridium sp. NkU-1 TaxID=1095009 RepID=UPI000B145EE4